MTDPVEEMNQRAEEARGRARTRAVDEAKKVADAYFELLHPEHKARAYRELQGHAVEKACEQERENTDKGVPD